MPPESMARFTPRMVLFDLDGTLVDSVPDLHVAVNAMQAELGNPERTDADVRTWVGNGIERLVERALTNDLDGKPSGKTSSVPCRCSSITTPRATASTRRSSTA